MIYNSSDSNKSVATIDFGGDKNIYCWRLYNRISSRSFRYSDYKNRLDISLFMKALERNCSRAFICLK